MRYLFPLSVCFAFLVLLAACGGGGESQSAGPVIQDPEAVALQPSDMPVDLVAADKGGTHVTNEQACATATDQTEKQACIDRLNGWGRRDHYQVLYNSTDPNALVSGVFQILVGVSVYDTVNGAAASFDYNAKRLSDTIKGNPAISIVKAATVGDQSVAWVNNSTQKLGTRDVATSTYVVDFRRGNTIVRTQVAIAKALGSVDKAVAWANRVDGRILRVSGWEKILGSPTPTAAATP